MFDVCGHGFQLTFENGLTVSVMFGRGNYGSNREAGPENNTSTALSAEFAVWRGGDFLFCDGTNLNDSGLPQSDSGWKNTNQVAAAIELVASFPVDVEQLDLINALNRLFFNTHNP